MLTFHAHGSRIRTRLSGAVGLLKHALWASFAGIALLSCAPTPVAEITALPQGSYALDKNHASVIWRVGHLNGLSRFVGRFDDFDATLEFDADAPEQSRLTAIIEADSINTGLGEFDEDIATHNALLNGDEHPQIIFTSTAIELTGENTARIVGDLTLRGVTAPLTMEATFNGTTRDPLRRNARVVGFSASGVLLRSAHGADAYVNFGVSDDVELLIEAEFIRQSG